MTLMHVTHLSAKREFIWLFELGWYRGIIRPLWRMVPFFYAQGRTDEIVAHATCAPRSEYGENLPYSIAQGCVRKLAALLHAPRAASMGKIFPARFGNGVITHITRMFVFYIVEVKMKEKLQKIKDEAVRQISESKDLAKLNDVRVAVLGKKGELTAVLKSMKDVSPKERPIIGQLVNETRESIEKVLEETKAKLEAAELEVRLRHEVIDVTLPAKKNSLGHRHPNTIALEEMERIFTGMGYEVVEGPEVEYDYYNFEALNIPANHPAKDEQDTFYINDKIVLRTQTSPVQVREMEKGRLPIRMIAPGRVFRSDEVDATHSPSFHQVEGLVIDKNITFADLKGTLAEFAKQLFGADTKVKFRPHHFPFTEPSAEMDVTCFKCGGKGCRFCKGEGWIEILGCGMVHPRVLRMSGIDPQKYSGFAFGVGLERIALLKYEIDDMRLLYENDQRFLDQF